MRVIIGLPKTFIIGFGIDFVYSDILDPIPPAKITTFNLFNPFSQKSFHKILFGQLKHFPYLIFYHKKLYTKLLLN